MVEYTCRVPFVCTLPSDTWWPPIPETETLILDGKGSCVKAVCLACALHISKPVPQLPRLRQGARRLDGVWVCVALTAVCLACAPDWKNSLLRDSDCVPSQERMDAVRVVGTTCLQKSSALLASFKFDYCIVDEASQVTQPVILGPLNLADVFILVGDHNQLPPLVQNKVHDAQRHDCPCSGAGHSCRYFRRDGCLRDTQLS